MRAVGRSGAVHRHGRIIQLQSGIFTCANSRPIPFTIWRRANAIHDNFNIIKCERLAPKCNAFIGKPNNRLLFQSFCGSNGKIFAQIHSSCLTISCDDNCCIIYLSCRFNCLVQRTISCPINGADCFALLRRLLARLFHVSGLLRFGRRFRLRRWRVRLCVLLCQRRIWLGLGDLRRGAVRLMLLRRAIGCFRALQGRFVRCGGLIQLVCESIYRRN